MKQELNVDQVLDDWFTEGPTQLPDRTVATIVEGLDDVHRRRAIGLPWRLTMPRLLPALSGTAIVLVVGALALGVYFNRSGIGVEPSPTSSASPAAELSRFISAVHGIALDYPSKWQARAANEPFDFGPAPAFDAPNVDVVFDSALQDQLYFALVSWKLKVTPTNDGCCSALLQATPSCSEAGGPWWVDYTLDGSDHGFIRECHDEDGTLRHTVAAAKGGRAYIIEFRVLSPALQETYDADWFRTALDTVHLFPVEARNP